MENEKEKDKGEEEEEEKKKKKKKKKKKSTMDEVKKGIPPKIFTVSIATETDRYDPADWPDLLDFRTTGLLIFKKWPLQILSREFDFLATTDDRNFSEEIKTRNFWNKTTCKESFKLISRILTQFFFICFCCKF